MKEQQTDITKNIGVYVMGVPPGTVEALKEYGEQTGFAFRVMLLWDSRVRDVNGKLLNKNLDFAVSCDFSSPEKIAKALSPYRDQLLAVTCRAESSISRFAEVIPNVPYLRTPTTESLKWATDKYAMRKRMGLSSTKLNPAFTLVTKNSKKERERVINKVGFPMIIKPTNMASSLFVTICYHEEELEQSLRAMFRRIRKAYESNNRLEEPKVIAEGYFDGDLYSLDTYVGSRGKMQHCPLVRQVTAMKIGHDDFYNYMQITPTGLKQSTIDQAESAAEEAIRAVGLRSTLVHTELMKVDDEWKIIELGARMGGFRHILHKLSCDINHSLNDVLVRIPRKVTIPKKCKGYASAMKWYAEKEGKITEFKGIKKIEQLESFHKIEVNKKIGDRAVFARNGGRSVFNLFMYNTDRSKLLADIRRVEKLVQIKVAARANGKKA